MDLHPPIHLSAYVVPPGRSVPSLVEASGTGRGLCARPPERSSEGKGSTELIRVTIEVPGCGSGKLRLRAPELASCDSCALSGRGAIFRTLEQIAALPYALGARACEECGHPEMRRLPDGVFHCPACGSEVMPLKVPRRSLPGYPAGSMGGSTALPASWRRRNRVRERS
jgi:hypothetical protein